MPEWGAGEHGLLVWGAAGEWLSAAGCHLEVCRRRGPPSRVFSLLLCPRGFPRVEWDLAARRGGGSQTKGLRDPTTVRVGWP